MSKELDYILITQEKGQYVVYSNVNDEIKRVAILESIYFEVLDKFEKENNLLN